MGLASIAAAIVVVVPEIDLSRLGEATGWQIGLLAVAVMVNLIITATVWWVITLSFDARPIVGPIRMLALICVSALLNYLPLRPGLLGRAAYLKLKHELPVRQSLVILLVVLGLSVAVLLSAAAIALVPAVYQMPLGLGLVVLASVATGPICSKLLRRRIVHAWIWVPLRVLDILVNGARLWLAFRIVDVEVRFDRALVAAAAGMIVSLAGLTPNGLGLREWIIGALAPILAPALVADALAAALVDRAIEAIVVIVTGLATLPLFRDLVTPMRRTG